MKSNAVKSFELEIGLDSSDHPSDRVPRSGVAARGAGLPRSRSQLARLWCSCIATKRRSQRRSPSSASTAAASPATSSIRCAATATRSCRRRWTASLNSPVGILIYLPFQEGRGIGLVNKIRAYALQDQGYDTVDANVAIGAPIEARDYDLAAHILFDLGYPEIKLLTNNPAKVEALREEGVDVIEQLPLIVKPSSYNKRYLATKKERMAHKL